eukprot:scaffold100242_cov31-Attheya_sp.AAC.1
MGRPIQDLVHAYTSLYIVFVMRHPAALMYVILMFSVPQTAIVNKGAETRVYMEELERRGMYDPRNPTGPLPTSLRPKLNQALNQEKMDPQAASLIFRALSSSSRNNPNTPPQK